MADEWIIKDYDGAAVATTLNGPISGATTSIAVTDGSGLPDGSSAPFVLVINRGESDEEKILVDTRSGNTLTVQQRGYDGTAAVAHLTLATVNHCIDAHTIKQANALAAIMASQGSMAYRSSGLSYVELVIGADDSVCVVAGGVPVWMTKTDFLTLLFGGAGAGGGLGYSAGVLSVTVDNVTIEIDTDIVRLKNAGVNSSHLNTSVAGSGLTGGGGSPLQVQVDSSTMVVALDAVGLKESGITDFYLADGTFPSIQGVGTLSTDLTVSKSAAAINVTGSGNPSIELRSNDGGTPFIDFSNDSGIDRDMRIILSSDDLLSISGGRVSFEGGLTQPYYGRCHATAAQSLNNGSVTVILFDSEAGTSYDPAGWHSTSSNTGRVTATTVGGVVHFDARVGIDPSAAGYRLAALVRYNSGGTAEEVVDEISFDAGDLAGSRTVLNLSGDTNMALGDYVQLEVLVNVAALNTFVSGNYRPSINWHMVCAA